MTLQGSTILVVLMLLGALVPGVIAYRLASRRTPGAVAPLLLTRADRVAPVVLMLASISTWIGGYSLSLIVSDPEATAWLHRISFLGVAGTPPSILAVALESTGRRWRSFSEIAAISIVPLVTMVLALTSDYHGWLWTAATIGHIGPLTPLDTSQGPWFWVHTVFSYSALAVGFVSMAWQYVSASRDYAAEGLTLAFAFLAPWAINIAYVTLDFPIALDPTPAGLLITVMLFYRVLRRIHLVDLLPVAWNTVIETLGDAIVVADGEARIIDTNRAAKELLRDNEPAARTFGDDLRQLLDSGSDGGEIVTGVHPEQRRSYDIRISPVPLARSTARVRVVAIRDVTERLQREEQARTLEKRLHQSQRLESVGILAGGIAHDFNNLLTAILGGSEQALSELPADHPARPSIELAIDGSIRAAELTRELLAIGGKGHVEMRRVELTDSLREIIPVVSTAIPKNVALKTELPAAQVFIEGDPVQIQRILMNLILNAAESYDGEPGVVTASIDTVDVQQPYRDGLVEHQELSIGQHAYVEVTDRGKGMSEATRARAFEPFFTTKPTSRGLGLSTLLGVVRRHHGGVALSSTEPHGTTLRVLFPIAAGAAPTVTHSASIGSGRAGARVLIVDDNPLVRSASRDALSNLGYQVVLAENGRVALDLFESSRGEFDVILLDMTMPGLNGKQVLHQLRQRSRDLPVILSSGYTEADIGGVLSSSSTSFLGKPYSRDALVGAIERAIQSRSQ